MTAQAMRSATQALLHADLGLAQHVIIRQQAIAVMSNQAEKTAFLFLASHAPVTADLGTVVSAIRIAADTEQMGAQAALIAKVARRRHPQHAVPEQVRGSVSDMDALAVAMATDAGDLLSTGDPLKMAQIWHYDDTMHQLHRRLLTVLIGRGWTHGVGAGVDVALLGPLDDRFADHTVQVARHAVTHARNSPQPLTPANLFYP